MMKLYRAVGVVAVLMIGFCVKAHCNNAEMEKISKYCKAKENATDADMKMWESDTEPKPRIVKCLEACVGQQLGLITENKLNVDAVMKVYASEKTTEKDRSNMKAILEECKEQTDKDRCEASAKMLKCMSDGSRKRGMKEIF